MKVQTLTRAAVISLAVLPLLVIAADQPTLTGTWKLNKDQSDDPREKMQEMMGGPGGPQRGERPPGPPEGRPGAARGGTMGRMMQAAESVTIDQEGDKIEIEFAEGRPMTLIADGSAQEVEGPRGTIKTTSSWQGGKLVSVREMGMMKISTSYELGAGGKQLIVTREIEMPRSDKPVVIKSVYEKEE